MVTREQFDAEKVAALNAVNDANVRATAQFNVLQGQIDALKAELAAGVPITDQDLTDLQNVVASANSIAPAPAPAPAAP